MNYRDASIGGRGEGPLAMESDHIPRPFELRNVATSAMTKGDGMILSMANAINEYRGEL